MPRSLPGSHCTSHVIEWRPRPLCKRRWATRYCEWEEEVEESNTFLNERCTAPFQETCTTGCPLCKEDSTSGEETCPPISTTGNTYVMKSSCFTKIIVSAWNNFCTGFTSQYLGSRLMKMASWRFLAATLKLWRVRKWNVMQFVIVNSSLPSVLRSTATKVAQINTSQSTISSS